MWPSRSSNRVRTIVDRGRTGDAVVEHVVVQLRVVGGIAIFMIVGLQLVIGQFIDLAVVVGAAPCILQMLLLFVSFFVDMTNLRGLVFAKV